MTEVRKQKVAESSRACAQRRDEPDPPKAGGRGKPEGARKAGGGKPGRAEEAGGRPARGEPRVFPVPARMEHLSGPELVLDGNCTVAIGPSASEDARFSAVFATIFC